MLIDEDFLPLSSCLSSLNAVFGLRVLDLGREYESVSETEREREREITKLHLKA